MAGNVEITGDIEADLRSAGYVPDDWDDAINWYDAWLCDASQEEIMGSSELSRHVATNLLNDTSGGADTMRVIVHYKCPGLAADLEQTINSAEQE